MNGIYPKSANGNFKAVDSIGVPHLYMITGTHMRYNTTMVLDIPACESKGAKCGICKKLFREGKIDHVLTFEEHEQALLVECKVEIQPVPQELSDYLTSIKDEATKNKYAGFAFTRTK